MKSVRLFFLSIIATAFLFGELVITRNHHPLLAAPTRSQSKTNAPNEKSDQRQNEALPKIVFLNQSAVLIASKKNREKYRDHQVRLIDLMNKGVTVLICPDCMKQYGVNAADLIDGVQVGKPSQTHES